jgi:hypothetical protein
MAELSVFDDILAFVLLLLLLVSPWHRHSYPFDILHCHILFFTDTCHCDPFSITALRPLMVTLVVPLFFAFFVALIVFVAVIALFGSHFLAISHCCNPFSITTCHTFLEFLPDSSSIDVDIRRQCVVSCLSRFIFFVDSVFVSVVAVHFFILSVAHSSFWFRQRALAAPLLQPFLFTSFINY